MITHSACSSFIVKMFMCWYCFLSVFYFSLLLHLSLCDLFTGLVLVHHSLQGNKVRQSHSEPGANSQGPTGCQRKSQTSDNKTWQERPAYFGKWLSDSEPISFFFCIHTSPPLSVKSWQSNQAPQLKRMQWTSLFQVITTCSHKPVLICIPFNLREARGKKMQIVQGGIEHVLIWTQSGLPSPEGWACSAAGSHSAVCFAKSMWKSEQNRKIIFSACISGTKYSLLISSLILLFKLQLITTV